jgi:hypothetical protein
MQSSSTLVIVCRGRIVRKNRTFIICFLFFGSTIEISLFFTDPPKSTKAQVGKSEAPSSVVYTTTTVPQQQERSVTHFSSQNDKDVAMNNATHQEETGAMKVGSSVVLCEQSSSETVAGEKLSKEESSSYVSMPTQDSITVDNSVLASIMMDPTQSLQQGTSRSSAREAPLVSENESVAHQDVTSTLKLTTAGVEEMENSEHQSSENPIKQETTVFFLFCFLNIC